jgi:hypothetical protein
LKKCSNCKESKPLTEFPKNRTNKDGYSYLCFICNRASTKSYREKNGERYYENQKRRRLDEGVFVSQTFYNIKTRAQKKGLEVDITRDYLLETLQATEYKCAVTGITFDRNSSGRKKANAFRASVDRIDSNKGYTKDNIRWVCWAVNQMKSDRTDEEFKFWVETLYKAISSQA